MISDRDIICFGNDWDGDPLSKKHIMQRLALQNRILWVNSLGNRDPEPSLHDLKRVTRKLRQFASGFRQVADRVFVLSPLVIPFHGNPAARRINRSILTWHVRLITARLGFTKPITWTFLPTSADIVGRLGESLIVYHCVDEYSEFSGTQKAAILQMEKTLMEKADVQIVSSTLLYEAKHRYNPNTFIVTHGVDVEHFRKACSPKTAVPPEVACLSRPVVGFFGLIADWVDLGLIHFLASARPEWTFLLIGKLQTDSSRIRGLRNVYLTGRKEYRDLPAYCKGIDIGVLPFVINDLTLAANPLKLREYLAAGLPVVSTAIPEAEKMGQHVRIGRSREEFLHHLDSLVESGVLGPQVSISHSMDHESWDHKVEEMSRIVSRFAEEQARAIPGRQVRAPSFPSGSANA
jgi:glycosyltransferase involved in cell wall biosynthesis